MSSLKNKNKHQSTKNNPSVAKWGPRIHFRRLGLHKDVYTIKMDVKDEAGRNISTGIEKNLILLILTYQTRQKLQTKSTNKGAPRNRNETSILKKEEKNMNSIILKKG